MNDSPAPLTASLVRQAVSVSEVVGREHYQEARTYRSLKAKAERDKGRLGYITGLAGVFIGCCSTIAVGIMAAKQTVQPYLIEINHPGAWVGPVQGIENAPRLFDEAQIRGAVFTYIEARESYDPKRDVMNWQQVRDMSAKAVFTPYDAAVNKRSAAKFRLAQTGDIAIPPETFWLSEPLKSPDGVLEYQFRFYRVETNHDISLPKEQCSGSIDIQFFPSLMLPGKGDTFLNPMGMQVQKYLLSDCHPITENK